MDWIQEKKIIKIGPHTYFKFEVSIEKDTAILNNDIISALYALSVFEKNRERLDNAIPYIKAVQSRAIFSEQNIEENIHDIL